MSIITETHTGTDSSPDDLTGRDEENKAEEKKKYKGFSRKDLIYIAILLLLGGLIYFFQLGAMTLWDTDEALYSEIAREMSNTGDFVSTQWNYSPWFCHPPMYFWMTVLSAKLMGWTEFAARFTSAFFGLLLIILVYFMGRLLINSRTGFYAGLITAANIQLWVQSRMAILDMPFLFFIIASVYAFLLAVREKKSLCYALVWVFAGLAVITKGPVGFILPAIYVFIYIVITKKWEEFKPLILSWGIPLFLLISVPWYWLMGDIYGQPFLETTFGYFFLKRIYAPVMNQDGPWYYYIPVFLAGALPWSAFIPLSFYFLAKNFSDYRAKFLLTWITFTFLLFTFAGTKRPNYILFLYPALNIVIGWAMDSIFSEGKFKKSSTISFIAFSLSTIVVIGAFIMVAMKLYPEYYQKYGGNLLLLTLPLIAGGIITLILTFKKKQYAFYSIVAMATVSYLVLISYIPLVQSLKPEPEMAQIILKMQKPHDRIALRGNFGRQFSIIYYTNQPVIFYHSEEALIKGLEREKGLFVVMHQKNFDKLKDRFTVPYTIIHRKGGLILFYKGDIPAGGHDGNNRRDFAGKIEIPE